MVPHPSLYGPVPIHGGGPGQPPPLLVHDAGRSRVAETMFWFRPVHWLDGGTVRGADLVLRPGHPGNRTDAGNHASLLLHEAGRQASLCETPLTLGLSLPAGLACDAALVRHAQAALRIWAPEHATLEFLLSEPSVAQAGADVLLSLSALRDLGIGLALQCGGGDMPRLHRLPLTCLRLPASVVHALPNSRPARLAVAQTVHLARCLDATVMAQGVQTEAQREILADLGCASAQGTLFGHPMPAVRFQAALLRCPHDERACA